MDDHKGFTSGKYPNEMNYFSHYLHRDKKSNERHFIPLQQPVCASFTDIGKMSMYRSTLTMLRLCIKVKIKLSVRTEKVKRLLLHGMEKSN